MSNIKQFIDAWKKKYPDIAFVKDIKSGKEASVVLIRINNELRCLKIYNRLPMSLKGDSVYLAGKWFKKPSEKKATQKKNNFGKELLQKLWVKREYYLLKKLNKAGASVPLVYGYNQNSILMEYLGDQNSPAPLIKNVDLTTSEANLAFNQIISSIVIFLENGIVHSDLSEFNILWWKNQPFIIDFPQAVDIRTNPNYRDLLKRDISNIGKFFSRWFKIDEIKLLSKIITLKP